MGCSCECLRFSRGVRKIREPVVAKFNERCQKITEVRFRLCAVLIGAWAYIYVCVCVCALQEMVCSSCHPFIGTWRMKNVCPSLCNEWYEDRGVWVHLGGIEQTS